MQETNGPTEVTPNRDAKGEPLVKFSKVPESEIGIPIDSMKQLDTIEHNNARATGNVDRETEEGAQQTSPQELSLIHI